MLFRSQRAGLPADADVTEILSEFGGFEIAMMTGALLAGAERGMVLLADGFIATSALLAAHRIAPAIGDYCIFSHCSAEVTLFPYSPTKYPIEK